MYHPNQQVELESAMATDLPIFFKFTASWCGPCQKIQPELDKLAIDYSGKMVFIGVDVDTFPTLSHDHDITAMPTSFIMKGGQCVSEKVVGANIVQIKAIIEDCCANSYKSHSNDIDDLQARLDALKNL